VAFVEAAEFVVGPCEADDVGAPACVGRQDAVVAVAMRAGRGNQPGESLEELEGGEPEGGAAVGEGAGQGVDESGLGPPEVGGAGGGVEPVQREGGPGTVPDQALETGAIVGPNADRSVEAEASGSSPCAHVGGLSRIEEAVAHEKPKHPVLNARGEGAGGVGIESPAAVEGESPLVVACEEAVEDDEVQVEVGVEAGAEAVQEGDGAEGGIGGGSGRGGFPQRSADDAKEDGEDASDENRIAGEKGAEPFGEREHPLAHGHVGDHVIAQVGGDFGHAAGGAGGADAASLAAEGEEALVGAGVTAQAGEAVGEDSAGEVAAEDAAAVRLLRLGEEGLEVVLDDGVERRLSGSAGAIDRRGGEGGWAGRRGHPACGTVSAGGAARR
jgi:hypothetical protein